jgi:flagellar hook-length control protein FliK
LGSIRDTPAGERVMTIRLRPPELGAVVVRINTSETGVSVRLVTESAAAANHLAQQRHLLLSDLEDSGLRGTSVEVSTGDVATGDQAGPGTGQRGDEEAGPQELDPLTEPAPLDPAEADGAALEQLRQRAQRRGHRTVDLNL